MKAQLWFWIAAAISVAVPHPAIAQDRYRCTVQSFVSFSEDDEFKTANRARVFEVALDGETITVRTISGKWAGTQMGFAVYERQLLDIVALRSDEAYGLGSFVMPSDPGADLAREGFSGQP